MNRFDPIKLAIYLGNVLALSVMFGFLFKHIIIFKHIEMELTIRQAYQIGGQFGIYAGIIILALGSTVAFLLSIKNDKGA